MPRKIKTEEDREKKRIYDRQRYADHPDKPGLKAKMDERIKQARQYVWNYLLKHPCIDCGETDPIVLEFDHTRGKKVDAVSNIVKRGFALTKIDIEIAKCDVRCANCHRRKTSDQLGWFKGS